MEFLHFGLKINSYIQQAVGWTVMHGHPKPILLDRGVLVTFLIHR